MMKKALIYFSVFFAFCNWSYAQPFELKDCYIENHYSFTQAKELSVFTSKEFNKNIYDYYVFSIDKIKKTIIRKWSMTEKEYIRRYNNKTLILKGNETTFNLVYLNEEQAKGIQLDTTFKNEILIDFKEKKVFWQDFYESNKPDSKATFRCK